MKFSFNEEQTMLRDAFANFFDIESSMARVRQASAAGGFDRDLWVQLAALGTFGLRVPKPAGGLELSAFDAAIVAAEAGRRLCSGPLVESLIAARLLAQFEGDAGLLDAVLKGTTLVTLAYHDLARAPLQWLAGAANADAVIGRRGDDVVLARVSERARRREDNLASNGIGEIDFSRTELVMLASGRNAAQKFAAGIEEWKLLTAAMLNGVAREAVRLAAAYASERVAFDVPIGTFQAISHPLANFITDIEGGYFLIWKAIHEAAQQSQIAGGLIPLTLWWNAQVASRSVIQSLRTFGGYGLSTEYDISLYNLRAKALPLIYGDPARLLAEAGHRLYAGESAVLPDVGPVSIDFDLGEAAHALAREVDDFFQQTLTPELRRHAHYSWDGHHPEVHRKLAQARLLFPAWPQDKGGRGATPYAVHAASAVWEKYGWSRHAAGTTMMIGAIIDRFGSDQAKKDILEPIARGEIVCSLGYSEPGSGSDVFAAKTRATREGDGWRIDGTKMFTSGANLADYVLMLTRTNPDVPKHKGLTMFMVPLKAPGVTVQSVHTFQDERTNITMYDGVRVPDTYRLGPVDGGVRTMSAGLELEHGGGFCDVQFAMLSAAQSLCRQISYEGRPLIEDSLAQMRLARSFAHCHISELLGLRALWSVEERQSVPAAGPMAKLFSSEKFLEDGSDLLNLTAPLSLSKRAGAAAFINQSYRHAHGTTIYAGTSEVHRSLIAERVLGLPRSR